MFIVPVPIISPPIPLNNDAVAGVNSTPNKAAAAPGANNINNPKLKEPTAAIKRKADRFMHFV
jgi:hypothetical protein